MEKIEIGDLVRDRVTGFEGLVVARTEWLNGCARITVQPRTLDKDGKPIEAHGFDDLQCEVVQKDAIGRKARRSTGGPREEVRRPEAK